MQRELIPTFACKVQVSVNANNIFVDDLSTGL